MPSPVQAGGDVLARFLRARRRAQTHRSPCSTRCVRIGSASADRPPATKTARSAAAHGHLRGRASSKAGAAPSSTASRLDPDHRCHPMSRSSTRRSSTGPRCPSRWRTRSSPTSRWPTRASTSPTPATTCDHSTRAPRIQPGDRGFGRPVRLDRPDHRGRTRTRGRPRGRPEDVGLGATGPHHGQRAPTGGPGIPAARGPRRPPHLLRGPGPGIQPSRSRGSTGPHCSPRPTRWQASPSPRPQRDSCPQSSIPALSRR